MIEIKVLYKDNTTIAFHGSDISSTDTETILSENPGALFSSNAIEIPLPDEDFSNVVLPHHVVVEEGVARILNPIEINEADQQNLFSVALNELRQERNKKLEQTDWWAVGDRTMTQEQINYRQALRDITETYSSIEDVVWPEMPEG